MSEAESPELNTDIQPQEQGQAAFNNLYSSENLNASSEFLVSDISVTESLDSDERLEEYENEVIIDVASATNITHVISSDPTIIRRSTTALIERIPTSRIKAGSRPPLSRSAYSSDAVPKLRDEYSWKRPSITLSNYPPAPDYFPFKSSVASV
ncbi:hypothetical protein F4776DRAFT_645172 [Hypoxylon sp. NC0597]|nr:hypothetical protein F4776DRAFT_645172 [Hypoxylon sp. NC0597]